MAKRAGGIQRRRTLVPNRSFGSLSQATGRHNVNTADSNSGAATGRANDNRGAARLLLAGAGAAEASPLSSSCSSLHRSTSAPRALRRSGGSISGAGSSVEDAECAAIIKAVMDRVTEYNLRNPSPPPMDVDQSKPVLPTVFRPKTPDIRCITPATLCDLIAGRFNESVSRCHIVDCRFDYEYEGGHIRNAIHVAEPHEAISRFFRETPLEGELPVCLVFHCEFSKNRAPKM
jgi:hypothetical protein